MKNKTFIGILILIVTVGLTALGCSSGGTSKVTVRINLPGNEHALNAPDRSIFKRFLGFFEREAAAAAPSNLTSLVLNVSGDGMETITLSYSVPLPSSIAVEVPAGGDRTFELIAYVNPSDPSAVVSYRGTVTRDLAGGETANISIVMSLYETKIIIPDNLNNRVVQIDDISGGNWQQISVTSPYDVDFDSKGRIYIARSGGIERRDDITQTTPDPVASTTGVLSLTMDRINNLLYFATSSQIYRIRTDISDTPVPLGTDWFTELGDPQVIFSAIAINNNFLYVLNEGYSTVKKLDLTLSYPPSRVVSSYSGSLTTLSDIIVKSNTVYFSVYGANKVIVQTDLNLNQQNVLSSSPSAATFYGPRYFVAILNNRFYVIDEDGTIGSETERIIAFDNFSSDWTLFYPSMVGQSPPFQFYGNC